jgi:hypothetical protein
MIADFEGILKATALRMSEFGRASSAILRPYRVELSRYFLREISIPLAMPSLSAQGTKMAI